MFFHVRCKNLTLGGNIKFQKKSYGGKRKQTFRLVEKKSWTFEEMVEFNFLRKHNLINHSKPATVLIIMYIGLLLESISELIHKSPQDFQEPNEFTGSKY